MTFAAMHSAIEGRFATLWADKTVPVAYANVSFDPPDRPWMRLTVVDGPAFQASLGPSPLNRYTGIVYVSIFVLKDSGERAARALADLVAPIFRQVSFSGLTFDVPYFRPVGPDGIYYQGNLLCPYRFDVIE